MVKRRGLGKRKRITQPQSEAAHQPELPKQPDDLPGTQASDPGDTATQARGHRRVGGGPPRHPVPWEVQEEEAGDDDRCPRGRDG